MFFRRKTSAGRAYLQIVESRREGTSVRQQVIATLGRIDELQEGGQLERLLRSGARFADKAIVLDALDRGEAKVVAARRLGPALAFERLWDETGCRSVIERLASARKHDFSLERAAFLTALDEMAGGGLDLFQLAFVDEAKGGVDHLLQVVPVVRGTGEAGHDRVAGLALLQAPGLLGGEPVALGRLVPREAARLVFLAASARAAIVASGLGHRGRALPSEDASLYATLLADARFHDLLLAVDRDPAEACRTEGCACGGRRHVARYARKPRGRPCRLGPKHDQRFSFCCAVDGCRSRATPPSLRFLGRRVYVATVVVLIAILRHGVSDARLERLSEVVSVDRRTIARWRMWWRDTFTATPFWRVARAAFMPPPDGAQLPAALIDRFGGDPQDRLVALLRFLDPVTGGALMRAF